MWTVLTVFSYSAMMKLIVTNPQRKVLWEWISIRLSAGGRGTYLSLHEYDRFLEHRDEPLSGYSDYLKTLETGKTITQEAALIHANKIDVNTLTANDVVTFVDGVMFDPDKRVLIVVTPVSKTEEWNRFDHIVDYYETDTLDDTVKYLEAGIFPWEGYMDKKNGKRLVGKEYKNFDLFKAFAQIETDKKKLDKLASKHGFKDSDDYKDRIVPDVPDPVRDLVSYLKLFADKSIADRLRPMLVTHWS